MRRRQIVLTSAAAMLAATLVLAAPARAQAQTYPSRVITMVVAYAPGGPGDTAARAIVDKMSAVLGQQIVIENVAGAGGMTGAARVARASPDGYTLLIHQTGLAIGPALYPNLPFNPEKDLAPVGLVNTSYSFLAARKGMPPTDLKSLVAWAKGEGRPMKFAHPGVGTLAHLQAVLFLKQFDLEATLVPYRGGALAMNDVIAEFVDLVWAAPTTSAELIKANKIKGIVYGAAKPYAPIPEIPGMGDLGYPSLAIPFWHALYAPAGTPREIVDKLNAALRETLKDPNVLRTYADRGLEAFPEDQLSPEALATFMRAELQRWDKVVKDNNIQAQ